MYKEISVQRLSVGMFVSLRDIPWFKHPFLMSSFQITNKSEIKDIVALGRKKVLYDPVKSSAEPLKKDMGLKVKEESRDFTSKASLKSEKASALRKRRERFQVTEKHFQEALSLASDIVQGVQTGQIAFYEDAKAMASSMAQTFLEEVELAVQHINVSASDEGRPFHSLNVMVLSLMLGKELELDEEEMSDLSFGALMHDIGQLHLPKKIVNKPKLSKLELETFHQHPRLGVAILSQLPDISREVMKVVYQHHEEYGGKGYPKGLKGDGITLLARIVSVADIYDRMINTRDPKLAQSPHKALAYLYAKKKEAFDPQCLDTFIKMLGVYPPGTVCRFTSGDVGVVMGVDPEDPLHPDVIIYDPAIPKSDAIIYKLGVDLDMRVDTTLGPHDLDSETFNYLDSRSSIQYFPSPKG